ncbi:MAG: twin-arginine translocation signal domain-containing protein, partial [Planctomycetota bacterium]|nr:twin-arginine translocation signal domain-containing protein [Planctomycetota bacterium]
MHAGQDAMQAHTPVAPAGTVPEDTHVEQEVTRRGFLKHAAAVGGVLGLNSVWQAQAMTDEPERLKPIGEAQGIHPGRVVWVHDPQATDWQGPGDGRWYEAHHTKQDRVSDMLSQAVLELTGQTSAVQAWDKLFRHLNQARGKGDVAYKPGEKIVIKPNWVGTCWWWGKVDPEFDGLYPGKHSIDAAPRRWNSPPFLGRWASSVLASQDPVAIDSVGCDFLWAEWDDYPRQVGVDDYLHEAALAASPPSGTFYDPDHP